MNSRNQQITTITLTRDGQNFIFRYTPDQQQAAMRLVGHFAADQRLPFTWMDAARVTFVMRAINCINIASYLLPGGDGDRDGREGDGEIFAIKEWLTIGHASG